MKEKLINLIKSSHPQTYEVDFVIEHPDNLLHGDYSSNVALILAKIEKKNPLTLAIELVELIKQKVESDDELKRYIEKVEVAGVGFINFYLSAEFFADSVKEIIEKQNQFGKNSKLIGKKIAVEYTDPNPFKQFHIGHLMSNAIGEALSRIVEFSGAEVKRFCYQGDVGRHVALTIWGLRFMDKPFPSNESTLHEKTKFLGEAYVLANKKIEENPDLEEEVKKMNKLIYERSDPEVNEIYDKGREWSLEHFEEIYEILGTKFDQYFFESKTSVLGEKIVKENISLIFKESEGAIVFKAGEYDQALHTRVFLNSEGLPTYEAKELGLAKMKYDTYQYDQGIIITANEQNEVMKVAHKALSFIYPEISSKTSHVSHGLLRLTTGKMGSRHGNVITGESLIEDMIETSLNKMKDREFDDNEKKNIATKVAVGAIKYSILKQSIGKDIIFDPDKSLSIEGDSGPYLQYANVRAQSILKKAIDLKIEDQFQPDDLKTEIENFSLIKILYRFPEIVEEALELKAPQLVVTYLTELASEFNSYYAKVPIVDPNIKESPGRIALATAFSHVMQNGLCILGVPIPEKM
jgi:arginyl-tRNA synthetase